MNTKKLPVKLTSYVFALYMAGIMAMLMCLIITGVNQGFSSHYISDAMNAYKIAMPAAFICILIVRPIVAFLVKKTVHMA
ncbi:DUF2798 domain-containing protein [Methylophaga sulfidovorans]|uniref:DUF2798 domain-containing protein n=1 Tax=Methylophaga sulfidovorans TaxID=45496 RepID=A0A1I3WDD2_9GAMM|nr:DUF2798 domain-containing protein [Methylophaga sulfidovorans]SFK05209.1 Protein of unknown function [Methylophaga sulfidovorans]